MEGGEPILGGLRLTLGPFDQQRFFASCCGASDRCRAHLNAGEARAQLRVTSLAPRDRAPSLFRRNYGRRLVRCGISIQLMSVQGQNPNLPHRNTDASFTSINGHKGPLADLLDVRVSGYG
jgi:hypothetical protein